jgi:hypothetical protein
MERSEIRDALITAIAVPDFASLHPDYGLCVDVIAAGSFALRAQPDLSSGIKPMLSVQSGLKKYFGFRLTQISSRNRVVSSLYEGRIAIVTDVGMGCGGRGSVGRVIVVAGQVGERPVSIKRRADERR